MKLFKISQDKNCGYETYDSAVVAAENDEEARLLHPGDRNWDGTDNSGTWCNAKDVKVKYLGEAKDDTYPGVIVASFNAG